MTQTLARVHFVCIGNCCRSQMAEGFARYYGSDLLVPSSSGLAPTRQVAWETVETMRRRGVDITAHYPKRFDPYGIGEFDVIVNLSGFDLPGLGEQGSPTLVSTPKVEEWTVRDPYGESPAVYRRCAAEIEERVQLLLGMLAATGRPIAP